jgi:nucleotide-binding universal stress UspA family protein
MLRKILVAFDGSESANKAFDFGADLASAYGAELIVLSVIRLPEPTTSLELGAILDDAREQFAKHFIALRQRLGERATIRTEVQIGHPAEHIVAYAEQERADLIVMGRRGRTTIARWMLGSVSERVLRYAHCPVTVVNVT